MMTREEAEKELIAMLEEAEDALHTPWKKWTLICVSCCIQNQIYLTGDTHGRFERIISFL